MPRQPEHALRRAPGSLRQADTSRQAPSLRATQECFAAALFDGDAADLAALIRADGLEVAERIGIYRNNLEAGFRRALALEFPVIVRLGGEPYFRALALDYLAAEPSRSGDLHPVGAGFARYLQARFAGGEYAYFGDIAALEWAHASVLVAADPPPLSEALEALRSLPEERLGELRFRPLPCAALLCSDYPIVRIWLANQEGLAEEGKVAEAADIIDLASGGERVLVCRGLEGVELQRLDPQAYEFAVALAASLPLATAYDAALRVAGATAGAKAFDPGAELRRLVGHGALVPA